MNMKTLTETSTFRVLSLLLCFCFFIPAMNVSASSLQADKFKVSGIVKDATGEPVIGASVVERGIDTSASNPYVNVYGGAAASLSTIYVYKYFDPTDTSNSWDNGQDFYVVRYAEVLLSLAEAMVQKGGYAYSDVTALVNEVRQRADVNMPTVEEVEGTSLSKDELLEVIKHERRVELAFEGLRLFDLYRWKELDKAVANIENERTMYGLAYEARKFNGERDYVWPLPTAELDTNKKLVQHDLWK